MNILLIYLILSTAQRESIEANLEKSQEDLEKLEFIKILRHQVTGIKQVNKSPHLPWGLKDEVILGLNFNTLVLKVLAKNK